MSKAVNQTSTGGLAGKKIFVGLSGGVDSAVTAALLERAGANVSGVFIKGWYPPGMPCTWSEDRRDAMRVAAHLRIPFYTLDASEAYRKGVIEYLLREYRAGRTPNPDIMCNREVKFGAFYAYAREHGADFIATGHYAQVLRTEDDEGVNGSAELARGVDSEKDQSYFLWAVPKDALDHTLFPLGGMQKSEVRRLAERFGLPNAKKRDSQGICFLGNVSVEDFLAQEFGTEPGVAIDADGTKIGTHQGALLSTLGQRVQLQEAASGPWYVIAKDSAANTLTVAHAPQGSDRNNFVLSEMNWLQEPTDGAPYTAQYRYHGPKIEGVYDSKAQTFIPNAPVTEPVAAGQSLVLYAGDVCLGGGIIE